jgi:hypothetical protein
MWKVQGKTEANLFNHVTLNSRCFMPISGASSYLPTINDFLPSWELVNATLGAAGPLLLRNPNGTVPPTVSRGDLVAMRDALQLKHADITGQMNNVQIAAAALRAMKEALQLQGGRFNDAVRSALAGTTFESALPLLPQPGAGQGVFVEPMDDIATLWAKINVTMGINGFTAPLVLQGGFTLTHFNDALALLKAQFELVHKEDFLVSFKIKERNRMQDLIYPILKAYRLAVPTRFAADDPLVVSLPKLTPEPGSTPDAVLANGAWNAPTSQGKLTWDESTSPDLDEYEVRWSPGPDYDADTEVTIANIPKTAPREYFTTQGLLAIGDESNFKVYVKTLTGNERGSNTVKITRTT